MFKNIAVTLRNALLNGNAFLAASKTVEEVAQAQRQRLGSLNTPAAQSKRPGRKSFYRKMRKDQFQAKFRPGYVHTDSVGMAKKISLGEVTLRGPRGLMVQRVAGKGRKSVYKIVG